MFIEYVDCGFNTFVKLVLIITNGEALSQHTSVRKMILNEIY
jgi:hypothetical protein